ncbi:hypothetical protein GJQ57_12260 [Ralstonia pickettii]|uniref:Gluconolactonase n=1 Tax=Ralstonia pickettii TaxID=329 RepID=A0A7X2HMT9_RALPI|nr:hypothetical protein [Ralstonia pickettii]MRS99418.1 hypothetical protein [Ralstonia pickettii]
MDLSQGVPVNKPEHQSGPTHPVAAQIIATWPAGTFVENLLARPDGKVVVSVHSEGRLEVVDAQGGRRVLAQFDAGTTGLSAIGSELFVSVGHPGENNWAVHAFTTDGGSRVIARVEQALFLNGSTPLDKHTILAADSILGSVFWIDTQTGASGTWLQHEDFKKSTPEPMMPGINGIKKFGQYVYFSSTERALLLRTKVDDYGKPGDVEVVAQRFVGDDFAFDVQGNLYVTTHVHNQVQRLSPDGVRTVVAGVDEWMHGSTAVSFGRSASDAHALYVTTTGGILAPVDGRVREAKLVRLHLGMPGAPVDIV